MLCSFICPKYQPQFRNRCPTVILYTEAQILDIRRFCIEQGEVLGFDQTFNLDHLHVTIEVFKNLAVQQDITGEHPIFIGPVFLHETSTFQAFVHFFSSISAVLVDKSSDGAVRMTIGNDDETALKNAIKFSNSVHVLCTRHLCTNANDHLAHKISANSQDRKYILKLLFGTILLTETNSQDYLMRENQTF